MTSYPNPMDVLDATRGGLRLNLGCGKWPMEGWYNIDQTPGPGVDGIGDLDASDLRLGWEDSSVDEVRGSHVIEHITHVLPLMQELWRVCKPDARATFACPYGSSDDADENPTHVRRMFVGSWGFFGQPMYWREDYGYTADWMVEEIRLRVGLGGHGWPYAEGVEIPRGHYEGQLHALWDRVQHRRNVVKEMVATLRCQKPARAADRTLQEDKTIVFEVLEPVDAWENSAREVGRLVQGLPQQPSVDS